MPTIIDEGNLRFTFPTGWRALKYDDSAFYRTNIPTDVGLAAVDFIVSPSPAFTTIILIEVKDFRNHAAEARRRQNSGELVIEVIKKALDTLSGLYVAAYLKKLELDNFIHKDIFPPAAIELILFMEEDNINGLSKLKKQNNKTIFNNIGFKINRAKSQLNLRPRVLNTTLLKGRDGFTVTHI